MQTRRGRHFFRMYSLASLRFLCQGSLEMKILTVLENTSTFLDGPQSFPGYLDGNRDRILKNRKEGDVEISDPDIPSNVRFGTLMMPPRVPLISNEPQASMLRSMTTDGFLIVQVVIPKCGTTTLKQGLRPVWDKLFASTNQSLAESLPFMAGDCEGGKHDGMQRCIISEYRNNFPCIAKKNFGLNDIARGHGCIYHSASNHLTYSEIKDGFLRERGIYLAAMPRERLVYHTILREPTDRVASEYFHWTRGWCCQWFFSKALTNQRTNITLENFVKHEDCPANNRQAWMLADLPALQRYSQQSAENNSYVIPGMFRDYFKRRYGGADDYAAELNRDESVLKSAEVFLSKADVVGLTASMEMTLAMTLFSFSAGRESFFSQTPTGCWELDRGRGTRLSMGHERASSYIVQPSERSLMKERNALDTRLYNKGKAAHRRLIQKYGLCGASG